MQIQNIYKYRLTLFIIGLFLLAGLIFIFAYTYRVEGKVIDITTQKPAEGIKLKIANHESITDSNGSYVLGGIKIYQKKDLVMEVPKEYTSVSPIKINYDARLIKNNFSIEPTSERIITLINSAIKNNQYDFIWDFVHPDVKKYWKDKDEYVVLNKFVADVIEQRTLGRSIKSVVASGNVRKLDSWKFQTINPDKEYKDILEVPVEIVYVQDGKEKPQNELFYYQRVDGFYHFFASTDKDGLRAMIKLYGVYDKINTYELEDTYKNLNKILKL